MNEVLQEYKIYARFQGIFLKNSLHQSQNYCYTEADWVPKAIYQGSWS